MKKVIFLTLFVINITLIAVAQDKKDRGQFGVRAGWHSALVTRDGAGILSTEPLNTFYVGIFKEKKLASVLYFGAGLEYFQNGFQSSVIDLKRKLHYISLPLYLKVKLGPVFATGGTALNFKVAENIRFKDTSLDPLTEKSRIFDLPLHVGLGVKIFMISIEARYNWGMINLNELGTKNQYFQLGLAVSF